MGMAKCQPVLCHWVESPEIKAYIEPMECLICSTPKTKALYSQKDTPQKKVFWHCLKCDFLFLSPQNRLSSQDEKNRYLTHHNPVEDLGYQNFVSTLIQIVTQKVAPEAQGLDFGCGYSKIIAHLMTPLGYKIFNYDPYFESSLPPAHAQYDFITACEVVEHLSHPLEEFKKIHGWLKPGGLFFAKTSLWLKQDPHNWYYSKDPTHVSLYNQNSLSYLRLFLGFSSLEIIDDRHFCLTK